MIRTKRKLLLVRHPFSILPKIFTDFDIAEFSEPTLGWGPYDFIVNTHGYDPKSDNLEKWKAQLEAWRSALSIHGEFCLL